MIPSALYDIIFFPLHIRLSPAILETAPFDMTTSLIALVVKTVLSFLTISHLIIILLSMLWPGSLVVASDRISTGGVFIYAMMAAGGDLGAAVGPQLVGVVTDVVINTEALVAMAMEWGLTAEQLGMKCGMLVGMLFPLVAIFVYWHHVKMAKS